MPEDVPEILGIGNEPDGSSRLERRVKAQQLLGNVAQREVGQHPVLLRHFDHGYTHSRSPGEIAVVQHHRFWRAGRARGVDESCEIFLGDLPCSFGELLVGDPASQHEKGLPVVHTLLFGGTLHQDDVLEPGHPLAHLEKLPELKFVLDERDRGFGVTDDVCALLDRVRRIDA